MYAAEMVAHCGIGSWTRNSRIVLTSADNLTSPFRFERELWPVFSHEPVATRGPNGEYVVFFTTTARGCGEYGPCVPGDLCSPNGTACNPGGPTCWTECADGHTAPGCKDEPTEASPEVRFPTFMAWSASPRGPFSEPAMVYSGADQLGNAAPATGDTNAATIILADGSLVGLWRGDRKQAGQHHPAYQYQYRVSARDWRDPSTYEWGAAVRANNVFPGLVGPNDTRNCGVEDPDVWVDARGVIHAVVHNWKAGSHAASADRGRSWRWYGGNCSSASGSSSLDWSRSVWPDSFSFENGTRVTPHRRERPHVVVGRGGVVSALTTAVQLGDPDVTWTLVQPTVA
jgi:hypothetical protein